MTFRRTCFRKDDLTIYNMYIFFNIHINKYNIMNIYIWPVCYVNHCRGTDFKVEHLIKVGTEPLPFAVS